MQQRPARHAADGHRRRVPVRPPRRGLRDRPLDGVAHAALALGGSDWDAELLDAFGVPRDAAAGDRTHARRAGRAAHAPLAGDAAAACAARRPAGRARGRGRVAAGRAKATYGTGVFVLAHAGDRAARRVAGLLPTVAWADRCGATSSTRWTAACSAAGALLEWLAGELGLADDPPALARRRASVEDAAGVRVLPALAGLGAPWWQPERARRDRRAARRRAPGARRARRARGDRLARRRHRRGDGERRRRRAPARRRRPDQRRRAAAAPGRRARGRAGRRGAPTRPCWARRCSRAWARGLRARCRRRSRCSPRCGRCAPAATPPSARPARALAGSSSRPRRACRPPGARPSSSRRPRRSRRARSAPSTSSVCRGPRVSSVSSTPVSRTCSGTASRTCSRLTQVGARAGDQAEQLGEAARRSGHAREDPHAPALLRFVAAQQRRQQAAVDVAAGDDRDGRARDRRQAVRSAAPPRRRRRRPRRRASRARRGTPSRRRSRPRSRSRMPSSSSRSSGSVSVPGRFTAIPSAIVARGGLERRAASPRARRGTARTRSPARRSARPRRRARRSAMPMPLASPPPPTGTITRARSGTSSSSSSAERRLAGDHVEVVERVHERRAGARGRALGRERERLVDRCRRSSRTLAPSALDRRHLRHGRVARHEHLACDARLARAAWATARPWLPALAVTSPPPARSRARRCLAERAAQLEGARRCRHSALSTVRRARPSSSQAIVGVRTATPDASARARGVEVGRARSARAAGRLAPALSSDPVEAGHGIPGHLEGIGCAPYRATAAWSGGRAERHPYAPGARRSAALDAAPAPPWTAASPTATSASRSAARDYVIRRHGKDTTCSASTATPSGAPAQAAAELGIAPGRGGGARGLAW